MRRFILALVFALFTPSCLPNPQSEWVTSEGSEQQSTLDDETIQAGNTFPRGCGCNCDDDTTFHLHVQTPHTHVAHAHVAHAGHAGHAGGGHGHH